MACKGVILTTYDTWDDPPSISPFLAASEMLLPHHQPPNLRPDISEDDDPESTLGSITRQILGFTVGCFLFGLREDRRY